MAKITCRKLFSISVAWQTPAPTTKLHTIDDIVYPINILGPPNSHLDLFEDGTFLAVATFLIALEGNCNLINLLIIMGDVVIDL